MDEKILETEKLSDNELDQVAGGSWLEFTADMLDAKKRGIAGFENLDLSNPNSDLIKSWKSRRIIRFARNHNGIQRKVFAREYLHL